MIIQTIKKFLAIFIIFAIWFFQVLGYTYDNLFVSYNSNSWLNTYILHSKIDKTKITTQTKNYKFLDGSYTMVSLKWLNITKNKLDFLTNYNWIISYNSEESFLNQIKSSKKDSSPIREYVVTSNNNSKNKNKEKVLNQEETFAFNNFKLLKDYVTLKSFKLTNKPELHYGVRAPPYIISLTMI